MKKGKKNSFMHKPVDIKYFVIAVLFLALVVALYALQAEKNFSLSSWAVNWGGR